MSTIYNPMTPAEQAVIRCSELYSKHGFRRFLMNKFEDYALYADNKNFLVDQRLLTFTDGTKLKALKPDVTLSIVKNMACDSQLPVKVFYNETVYRIKKGDREFSELRQMGIEHIGDDSLYATSEILSLAKSSLDLISTDNILDISHIGILMPLIDQACEYGIDRDQLILHITQKNADAVACLLKEHGFSSPLATLVGLYAPISQSISLLFDLLPESSAVKELSEIVSVLHTLGLDNNVYLDLSLMHDFGYYNGIIFKGYLKGVPVAVLSGGRYDPLLSRFGVQTSAMGFAIYLDYIEYSETTDQATVLLLYTENDSADAVARATQALVDQGYNVMSCRKAPENRLFTKTFTLKEVLK